MTAPVKLTKRARIIAAPVLVLVHALAVFAAHQLRRELTACFEWPDVELLVEDEPQPDYAYSEYYGGDRPFVNICTGADLLFRDKRGTDYYYVPSLEYIGMLFMPEYAHCVIRAPSDTEYLSISCSQGGLDKGPRSVSVYRLSIETAEKLPQHPWTTARRCCLRQRTGRRSRSRSTAGVTAFMSRSWTAYMSAEASGTTAWQSTPGW